MSADKSLKPQRLTVDFTVKALLTQHIISKEQAQTISKEYEIRRMSLQKVLDSALARKSGSIREIVSPAEVIASYELELLESPGKLINEDIITEALAKEIKMPYKKLDPLKLDLAVVTGHVPRPFALKYTLTPIEETGDSVVIAVADPFNMEGIDSLKQLKKIKPQLVLSSRTDIIKIVREFFGFHSSIAAANAQLKPTTDLGNLEQYVKMKGHGEIEVTDSHVINAVEYLMQYAFDQRASDIHIEPKRDKSVVRLRIDGVMHYVHSMPKPVHAPVTSRLKMMSRMDITERRRPQDGRIKTTYKNKELELRVSTLPVAFGEKIVIRIFDPDVLMQTVENLGFYPREYQQFSSFLNRPNGIIMVTGPTGSGKTTTLYSSLRALSSPEVNIITIEDPIEMVIEDFNQVGVQAGIGVTFANILRTVLRQDPDIIMVGEIRDKETAENAIQSALTGHLVLSTLHTNDAPSTITRLLDLGIQAFLISSTIIGVVAQRLVRKICPHCKQERKMIPDEIDYLQLKPGSYVVHYGEGCIECRGTGYRGRTAIFEIMELTERFKRLLTPNADAADLYKAARADGMVTLRESAIRKMLDGITTYEEVVSMTG
ncbi:MAG: type II/IV secretion system protein [Nitrospirae bacterium]|nr:type II/IV secretion system protein [Nitrospirota bacterium]MBF0536305.1 type II/IV secretion system protein [Nitrospirota bacterium]MBF0618246.1 type II/IV secretion system protein [Nitrospirota bacterium]